MGIVGIGSDLIEISRFTEAGERAWRSFLPPAVYIGGDRLLRVPGASR